MRNLALAALFTLAACQNGALTPGAAQTFTALCAADPALYATGQVSASLVPVPGVAAAGTADSLIVHPAVVAACANLKLVPVAVTTTPTPAAAPAK